MFLGIKYHFIVFKIRKIVDDPLNPNFMPPKWADMCDTHQTFGLWPPLEYSHQNFKVGKSQISHNYYMYTIFLVHEKGAPIIIV